MQYARQKYNLAISERMGERIKINIGSAYPLPEEKVMGMRGRNLITGLPEEVEISSIEVREALSRSVNIIVDLVRDTLDETPPELVADLMEMGICLTGGGANLRGLAERLTEETHIRAWTAQDSLTCVARGAGRVLEQFDLLRNALVYEEHQPGGSAA
jgi:rod shape-determining protein MreB